MSYISRNELWLAYYDCLKHKRRTKNANDFVIEDSIKMEKLYRNLNTFAYLISKSIVFTLHDDNGDAYREVFAANFEDRIVHHLLANRLRAAIEKYDLIEDNYACRVGKGTYYGARRALQLMNECLLNTKNRLNVNIIKGDFKNFFNSLNKELMCKHVEWFINKYMYDDPNKNFNLWLSKMIIMHSPLNKGNYIRKGGKRSWKGLPVHKSLFNCDSNHGIAVGNLTSLMFANFYLSLFDHYIKDELGFLYYGRYVDDFYIITDNTDFKGIMKKIKDYVSGLDLLINVDKTYKQYYEHGMPYIGYFIKLAPFYTKNTTVKKFRKLCYSINLRLVGLYESKMIFELTVIDEIMPKWNSYIGMFSNCNSYNIIKKAFKEYPLLKGYLENYKEVVYFDKQGFMKFSDKTKKLKKYNLLYGYSWIKELPDVVTNMDDYSRYCLKHNL